MCGIVGYLSSNFENKKSVIQSMTKTLSHRGPDKENYWNDDFISLGHTRLSVIDLSSNGDQPMVSYSGRFVIVFNVRSLSTKCKSNSNFSKYSDLEPYPLIGKYMKNIEHKSRKILMSFHPAFFCVFIRNLFLAKKFLSWGIASFLSFFICDKVPILLLLVKNRFPISLPIRNIFNDLAAIENA